MKGLVYKDFINMKQQFKLFVLIIGIWMFVSIAERNLSFFGGVMAIFSIMMPLTAYSYDEKVGWDKYALTMPISRKEVVLSKYLFGGAALFASFCLTLIVGLIVGLEMIEIIQMNCVFVTLGLVCMGILLPVIFRFGVEKGRYILMLFFLVVGFGSVILNKIQLPVLDADTALRLNYLAPVVGILICLLSVPVSMKIYGRKEI